MFMYKKHLLICALSAIALSSCEKNDASLDQSGLEGGESAVITVQDIELPPLGNHSMVLSFYAEESWRIEKPDWITITPSSGKRGNTKITVSANVGEESDYENNVREDVVKFVSNAGNQLQSFKVKQQRPYLHIVPVKNQTKSSSMVKAAPEDGYDYVFEWDEYGSKRDSWDLAVESNIDWNIPAHNENYEVVVENGQPSDTDRFLRRSTVKIRPFKMNNTTVPDDCDVQLLPDAVKSGDIDAEQVECPQDLWKFKHKNLTFLVNGRPLSNLGLTFNMGQLTAEFASLDKDESGALQAIRDFDITIDATQGVKFSEVKITTPDWMEEKVDVIPDTENPNKATFQLRVKSVYYDETQLNTDPRTDKVNVQFHAPNAGGEDLQPEADFDVTQEPFLFGIRQNGELSLADIVFENDKEDWQASKISVDSKVNWYLRLKDASQGGWVEGDIFDKEYSFTGSVDVAPSAQNMSFTTDKINPNTAVLRVVSKVDPEIYKDINISQKQFIFDLTDDWRADEEKKLNNMYSGDLDNHPMTLKISGEWEAHVYDVEKGAVTNKECSWLKLSQTSGDGDNTGEGFTITPQNTNISEDANREARLVVTSLRHSSGKYSDTTRFLDAVQKKIYFNIILKEEVDGKESEHPEGASLRVPAYKKKLNRYRVYLDCSREVVKNVEYLECPDFLTLNDPSQLVNLNILKARPGDAEKKNMPYLYLNNRKEKNETNKQKLTVRFTIDKGSGIGYFDKTFYFQQDGYVNTMEDKSDYAEVHPYAVPASGLDYTFKMTKEAPWSAEIIDGSEWITLKRSSGSGTGEDDKLGFTIAKNPTSEQRTGTISIKDEFAPENSRTITVTQAPYDFSVKLFDKAGNPVDDMKFRELGSAVNTDEVYTVKVTSSGPFKVLSAVHSGSETQNSWLGASTINVTSIDNTEYPVSLSAILNESISEGGRELIPMIYPVVLDEVNGTDKPQNVISPKAYSAHQDAYKWDVEMYRDNNPVTSAEFGALASTNEEKYVVKIKSSGPWTMPKPDWITGIDGDKFEGLGNQDGSVHEFTFGASNNRTLSAKSSTLVPKSNLVSILSKNYSVSQKPFVINLAATSLQRSEPMDETPVQIALSGTTNNFTVTPANPDLFNSISYDPVNGKITCSPKKNVSPNVQTDVITIKNNDCDAVKEISYKQAEYVFKVDDSSVSKSFAELSPAAATIKVTVPKDADYDFSDTEDNEGIIKSLDKVSGGLVLTLKDNVEKHEKKAQFKVYSVDNPELNKVVSITQLAYRFAISQKSVSCVSCPTTAQSNQITCSGAWTASSSENWLTVIDKDSATANDPATIRFQASNNPSENERTAQVTVVSKENPEISEVFEVKQNGHTLSVGTVDEFGPYNLKDRTKSVDVTGDGTLKVRCDATWVTPTLTGSKLTIVVGVNSDRNPREADIEVYCPDTTPNLTKTVHIKQAGYSFDETAESITIQPTGGNSKITSIQCSGTWTAETGASWIKITSGPSMQSSTLEFNVDSNTGKEKRTAEIIIVCDQNNSYRKVLTVTQSPIPPVN